MKISQIRDWLGLYFLSITVSLGGYLILCSETIALPISKSEAMDCLEIIIPVLIGQLTLMFKWYGIDQKTVDKKANIPSWVVKGPPIMVSFLLLCSIVILIVGNLDEGKSWVISPDTFKRLITFCVSVLTGTSVFIVARFFKIDT